MTAVGFALSSELHGPDELIAQARPAEAAGFDFVALSDHFHPWLPEQGESPFAWTVLGGVAEATDEIDVGTGVTCPIQRYHPAILAQATATAADRLGERFCFGVGAGERLNEHVVGDYWPPATVRHEMLDEAVRVIRALCRGEESTHHGTHYTVENARLFTLPDDPPPVYVSAYGPKAARLAADIGDGFYTVGPRETTLQRFHDEGGEGPAYTQLTISYAETEAVADAYERWPNTALPGDLASELATPVHFRQASEAVEKDDIAEGSTVTDPDPTTHVETVEEFADAGFDHVVVHQVGADVDGFFETYADEVLPEIR
ncbi:TIGR03557 family F420-dependent LLM class oxidoreductase [Halorientalis pallida]|uniref:TIGR03557 family F420-dependent LLM class oxidoreductase n=1 Tax=Halorientalis pallida TaxID=2479928 RepID=A0A498KQJ3_9EURY|nr:TIGR03557 family F420-dependent LLM class oxidoreductase [Halorientalis pallida]RXK46447.1 TIGR03557 family F420-dependent LLM class oxidoreductase [Halorientalis pallida]